MADVSSDLKNWSATASSNSPSGSTNIGAGLDDNLREIQKVVRQDLATKGADIASATTTDVGAVAGVMHDITGTTTITGLGTVSAGIWKILKFEGALTLTHNATSLILPGQANITTADGDIGVFISEGSGNWRCVSYFKASGASITVLKGFISGLTYSNNGSDATNDLDIAAGVCADSTGVGIINVSALTKQSDASWAVGTNAGALDTGAVGNNDYYIWAIKRVDTGVSDILFSLSSTAPTMPANYTLKRLIGWFKRSGGAIVAFTTFERDGGGLGFRWTTPTLDINLSNTLTTSRRTDAVKVPLNFAVDAVMRVEMFDASSAFQAVVCCPDETDAAPSATAAPLVTHITAAAGDSAGYQLVIRTSSAGLIAARANLATVDLYTGVTVGFNWGRRI